MFDLIFSSITFGYWCPTDSKGSRFPQESGHGPTKDRVCSDPGKVWKVVEFKVENFQALKSLEYDRRYGKSGKILENYEADLENIAFHYILRILHHAFVTLLLLYIADIFWSKF